MSKPYAASCDQNKAPILAVLRTWFAHCQAVLEIGSGTGQHAVFFAQAMPHLVWHTSDQADYHAGILAWLQEAALDNLRAPLLLEVKQADWPVLEVDAVFSANTTHIMDWPAVTALFNGVGRLLPAAGLFVLYGPFNQNGQYTSASNAQFDAWLKQRDPHSGIRDLADLDSLAQQNGLWRHATQAMPMNNQMLCWKKSA